MNIFKNKQTNEYKEKERYRLRKARVWGYKIGKKYGIGEKIAKANAWADVHRRKTAGILFSVNTCIYLIGFVLCMSGSEADGSSIKDPMQDFEQVQPMFSQLHRIENMKAVEKSTIVQLSDRAVRLKREVDSLMAKRNKTHEDSVTALAKYEELQTIMDKTK
jgi:hypothetical protein